jgi:hypothetical protein
VRKVLNVGGNNKAIPLPPQYDGWEHVLLDIDPRGNPDVVCDARQLTSLPAESYDSVYCSHNLEHYYHHDVSKVLAGFFHIIKPDGFVYIRVPDILQVMRTMIEKGLDIEDTLYESGMGPISVRDVIYGHGGEIERSGNDFFAHKTGFTPKSLMAVLLSAGFGKVGVLPMPAGFEVTAFAFKDKPSDYVKALLGIPDQA